MDDTTTLLLKRFASDPHTVNAVHALLLSSFLKPQKNTDVYHLAASRIAIDLLDTAWKELDNFKYKDEKNKDSPTNIGI